MNTNDYHDDGNGITRNDLEPDVDIEFLQDPENRVCFVQHGTRKLLASGPTKEEARENFEHYKVTLSGDEQEELDKQGYYVYKVMKAKAFARMFESLKPDIDPSSGQGRDF